ncbi:uncharacterized protein [Petaurus breviceps papuanus]|uniref:uncharacterized protein n=1 Tax=Petaurus breviceps papuanus TaxID=3040969 RepID=UPI0036DB633D
MVLGCSAWFLLPTPTPGREPETSEGHWRWWYELTDPVQRLKDEGGQKYWALAKRLPTLRAVGWGHTPIPLAVIGNASILTGTSGRTITNPVEKNITKPVYFVSPSLPICLFVNDSISVNLTALPLM